MRSPQANVKSCLELSRILTVISGKYCVSILTLLSNRGQPLRFNELRHLLGNVACKSLSATLKKLEQEQLVLRTEYCQIPPKVEYSLTEAGQALIPVLATLRTWQEQYPNARAAD